VEDVLRGSPMPDGWGQGVGIKRTHQVAFKTGTSYGYRDAWAVGYSPAYTVAVWVGRADGSARTEQVGRNTAAPLVFRIFDLLPAEPEDKAPPPADALVASSAQALPEPMRRFFANRQRPPRTALVHTPAPQIAYPPNGAIVSIGASPQDRRLQLRASGGEGSLRWVVNGKLLPRSGFLQPTVWTAPGPGFAHIVVIDGDGRAAAADVRLKLGSLN
jgi:penicillin-binding protein 1C